MKYLNLTLLPALLLLGTAALADPFPKGDVVAGQKFFAQNRCNRCHDGIMGGDGSRIFTRFNRKVKDPLQLIEQMHVCTGNVGITLTRQDEQNLGAFLNGSYYHFK